MAFKFRFQSVLNYRRHQAEIAELELAKVAHQLALVEEQLKGLKVRREAADKRLVHCLQEGVPGRKLQLYRLFLTDLETRIDEESQRAESMRLEVEDLRARLLEANRKKKSMEKLLSREEQAWLQQQDKRHEKELSEIAVQLHTRRS